MRAHTHVACILAAIAACVSPAGMRASAQNVKVEVVTGESGADRVPRIFGYGGNIWRIPEVFGAGIAQRILSMNHLGITRISLGDQVLTDATSLEDLQRRLDNYPLNEFLQRYAKAGGRVLFILDGMPRWVSSNKSDRTFPNPDQKVYRMSPPDDFNGWSRVVETIVRHFNGKLGLNAYYECWNEPNWYYLGTTEQFHKQYYYSVLGARKADPRALIGGPSVSEFLGVGTRGDSERQANKAALAKLSLEQQFAFRRFLSYAGKTPVPELGLNKLPVDFFSWHSFYIDPTIYYQMVVPAIRAALVAAGYPGNTPLIDTEWNIAAVPPYPEGNLNANEVGAAFVATSLIAMHETGVNAQIFQMYLDPGVEGYAGGTFTYSGIPRANFNTFRLYSMLKGRELKTRSSDPWVKSVAFHDGKNIYLMVATFVPTTKMTAETVRIYSALSNAELAKSIAAAGAAGGSGVPEPLAGKVREAGERNKKLLDEIRQKAVAWKSGLTLDIALSGGRAPNGPVAHYVIDSQRSNIYRDLAKATQLLAQRREQIRRELADGLGTRLQSAGVSQDIAERIRSQAQDPRRGANPLAAVPADKREGVAKVLQQSAQEALARYSEALREIENWPSAQLHQEAATWPSSGNLRIRSEPYAVHLFVLPE